MGKTNRLRSQMMQSQITAHRIVRCRAVLLCVLLIHLSGSAIGQAGVQPTPAAGAGTTGVVIEPAELPLTYPRAPYHVALQARGNYVPVLHWSVQNPTLPPGIVLDDNGT